MDDGSTDGTTDIVRSLQGIRFFQQSNSGPAAARNVGIREAQGDILGFLDADDLWAAGKLAAQLDVLRRRPDVHLVAGRVDEFSSDEPSHFGVASRDYGERAYTIGALLMRREDFLKVGEFNPVLRFGEFMDWLSRARTLVLRELVLDQVVLHRRHHAHNTTRLACDHQRHYLETVRRHLERRRTASKQGENHDVR